MEMGDELYEPVTLTPENDSRINLIGGWMCPKAHLHAACCCRESNLDLSMVQVLYKSLCWLNYPGAISLLRIFEDLEVIFTKYNG